MNKTLENNKKSPQYLLVRYLPILGWLPKYERTWLRTDLIAGLTVVALLIPEGMAYAQIAGMPPQTALCCSEWSHTAERSYQSSNCIILQNDYK